MDEVHLAAALRRVALNPVRARLVKEPADWRWSSLHEHLGRHPDGITAVAPVLERHPRRPHKRGPKPLARCNPPLLHHSAGRNPHPCDETHDGR